MTVGHLILHIFNWQFKKDSDSSRIACIAFVDCRLYICEMGNITMDSFADQRGILVLFYALVRIIM